MTRLLVTDARDGVRVPFLRGILTRCLQDVGLSFEDAYRVATTIREECEGVEEITIEELQERVVQHLEPFGKEAVRRYQAPNVLTNVVRVKLEDGQTTTFSRGRQRSDLESCGLSPDQALTTAEAIAQRLAGRDEIEVRKLRYLTHEVLTETAGPASAQRYVVWEEFQQSDRPLLLLLGGTAGSGKSTIATQVANRLEIVRSQSTDMLREVMRMMIPQRLLPVLHSSSFKAWQDLAGKEDPTADPDTLLFNGYLTQTELLSVACEAVIQRAVLERVSLILEGVHIHPSILDKVPEKTDAIVIPIMLAVLKPAHLRRRIKGRSAQVPTRRTRRYLDHFEEIWRLQSFLLAEADRTGMQIVSNEDREKTIRRVMAIIVSTLVQTFTGTPKSVFG